MTKRLLVVGLMIAAVMPRGVASQTLEIQKEIGFLLESQRENFFQWGWRWLGLLSMEVNTTAVREAKTLGEALDRLEEQLRENKPSIMLIVGNQPTNDLEAEDIWQVPVNLSGLPRSASVSRVLLDVLDQMPVTDVTVVSAGGNCLYITNLRVSGRSRLLFYWALRFHRVRHLWRVCGLICAVAFVYLRRKSMGRRHWLRLTMLALGTFFVFFVWPAWLLWLAGTALYRRLQRNSTKNWRFGVRWF